MGQGSRRTARPEDAVLPIVTSFFTPAFMAELRMPRRDLRVICDTDVARAWASIRPRTGRIRYFAPNWRVALRLGVAPSRVHYRLPLPEETQAISRSGS
jgi:hypothetical protein